MKSDGRELLFFDRHRCQLGVNIVEEPGWLRVEPKRHSMRWVVAWMVFVHLVIIGIIFYLELWREDPKFFALFFGVIVLELPMSSGILFAISRSESAKGPLLEVDESRRIVTLLRDDTNLKFDDITAVFLLIGWYTWTDWEKIAEMSLIVRNADDVIEQVPIILHNDVPVMENLADRVAGLIGKPIEQVKLTWKERQADKVAS